MLLAPEAPFFVPNAKKTEPIDREVGCLAERHQRTALHHEAVKVPHPFFSDSAVILGANRRTIQSIYYFAGSLAWDDHHIEPVAQLTLADIVVMELRHVELVLLQNPTRPPLIDVFSSPRGI